MIAYSLKSFSLNLASLLQRNINVAIPFTSLEECIDSLSTDIHLHGHRHRVGVCAHPENNLGGHRPPWICIPWKYFFKIKG